MGGLVLAMTTMATYTSVSSFVSGPGAAGLTYGYAQAWVATVQVPVTFLVLGVLGNKLALVSRRTGAVTVAGYLRARYKKSCNFTGLSPHSPHAFVSSSNERLLPQMSTCM